MLVNAPGRIQKIQAPMLEERCGCPWKWVMHAYELQDTIGFLIASLEIINT